MRLLRFLLMLLAALLLAGGARAQFTQGATDTVTTEQVRATLLAFAPQGVLPAQAGEAPPQVWLGLRLEHTPGWHTYWRNAGDSGAPTELHWTLPAGVQAGDIAWPVPHVIAVGDLHNFGYEGSVLLPVPLEISSEYQPGAAPEMEVRLHAVWLACKLECLPQEGDFELRLPLHGSTALAAAEFEAALASQPDEPSSAEASATPSNDGALLALRVAGLPAEAHGKTFTLLPEVEGVLVNAPPHWEQRWENGVWLAEAPISPERYAAPDALPLLLAADGGRAWRMTARVQGEWTEGKTPEAISPALQAAIDADKAANKAPPSPAPAPAPAGASFGVFLGALLGAFIGGILLNLMPCVFPVLAIKVMGFAQHGSDQRAQRAGGVAYAVGVVLSFLLLGALMLALRAAGQQLGWGFQLQSPAVVAALATLFALIGLNLSGVFEVGQFLPASWAAARAEHPTVDALLSGVLAVAVASPCTAPFMGAALGLAIALPAMQALLLFAAIGCGMALPYLAAAFWPALAQRLPRPGAWMEVFRRLMAFPMYGAAVWLLWVLGQQTGINGAAALLALLVALALLLWTLGLQGKARRWLAPLAALLLAALLMSAGPLVLRQQPENAPQAAAGARWQPWSAEAQQALLAQGKPVFVDFTAAWCVTCQYNKRTTLTRADVLAALDAAGVQTLRADWTRRDATIGAELQRLGRAGVPTYVLQAPGKAPTVMREIISADELKAALAAL
ncbi:MAG: thioredoxin family protein [Ottowia sp.]|nr:thioredoxin family protein [Ottowia sp.]